MQKQVDGSWKDVTETNATVEVGQSYGNEAELGLDVARYSDRSILVTGSTYVNLALLRQIKEAVGAGVFNKTLNGWIFPHAAADTVLGLLAGAVNHKESTTAQEQRIQDNAVALKNAVDVGTHVEVHGQGYTVVGTQVVADALNYQLESKDGVKTVPVAQVPIEPASDEQAVQTLQNVTPESRVKNTKEIFGRTQAENEPEPVYDRPMPTREYVTPTGETVTALDLSEVAPMDLRFPVIDDILTRPTPTYVPPINEYVFSNGTRNEGFLLDSVPLGDDKYLVFLNGSRTYSYNVGHVEPAHAVMSLDNLVITMEHYRLKHKAKLQAKTDERNERQVTFWEKQTPEAKEKYLGHDKYTGKDLRPWAALPKTVQKKVTPEAWAAMEVPEREKLYKPIRTYGIERMTLGELGTFNRSMFERYQQFVDKTYSPPPSNERYWKPDDKAGSAMLLVQEQLKQRRVDLRIQGEDQGGTFKTGRETSFGDAKLQDTFLGELGVRVKAQDGTVIEPVKQEEIATALRAVYGSFGDRSELARNFGLKVSHAGSKHMHASNALGVYAPRYKAIGVGAAAGDRKFGFTLAHEFAHFLDHRAGNERRRNFASDDPASTAGQLARTFRKHMNGVSESDYINRTCECFARACEQYHATRTHGSEALHIDKKYVEHENFVNQANFEQHVKPLVERFLAENDKLIKGAKVGIFEL